MTKAWCFYRYILVAGVYVFSAVSACAFTLSATVEAITTANVGAAFQTVSFENTYANAVPVCTYVLPSAADPPATVRITGIGSTSMQVRIQQFENSSAVTAGTVHCLVAELGANALPDGTRIEARTVLSEETHGQNAPPGFNNAAIATMENVSGLFSGFTNPIALGQVISFNDVNASTFHSNDCDARTNPPFDGGFADGICVSKNVGQINTTRADETLGIIVIESGSGTAGDLTYEAVRGADSVAGVGNAPPYNYGLTSSIHEFAVATLTGADGGQGGWAVLFGTGINGSNLGLAIDEETVAGDLGRGHTQEQVDYFAVGRIPDFTVAKVVDRPSIAETLTLNYEITLENTSRRPQNGVAVTDTLPDGSTGTVSGPTETGGTIAGVFEAGETWVYTVSYPVTAGDILTGADLINNVSVTTTEYTAELFTAETSLATTTIEAPNPSITVTKSADQTSNVAAGVTVTYTYRVVNNGNQFISNISLADSHNGSGPAPAPANESLDVDNGVTGDSINGTPNDGIWQTLAPGDEITFTATYIVTQNDVDTLQ